MVVLSVALVGAVLTIVQPVHSKKNSRWMKIMKLCAVLAGAMAVLWGSYLFGFSETLNGRESFNRPLALKIADVTSPGYRAVLTPMAVTHVVPRTYLSGFADTIRAGMEGRENPQLIFGRTYHFRGPKYFFPAIIAVKVPIGLTVVMLLGLSLFLRGRIPQDWIFPCAVVLAVAGLILLVLSAGETYAGIRHALPVAVPLSVFAGIGVEMALSSKTWLLKILVAHAFAAAAGSALPQMRPWEYFDEFVGGTANAYKYFVDEGGHLGQRAKELARTPTCVETQ